MGRFYFAHQQSALWPLIIPMACRYAYMIVVPTNRIPRRRRSREIASEISECVRLASQITAPPAARQMYASNEPNSRTISRNTRAFFIAARIFNRLRIIPASAINRDTSASVYSAMRCASNPSNARRKFSRLFNTHSHDNPAWNDSSTSISNNRASSCTARPHSVS